MRRKRRDEEEEEGRRGERGRGMIDSQNVLPLIVLCWVYKLKSPSSNCKCTLSIEPIKQGA